MTVLPQEVKNEQVNIRNVNAVKELARQVGESVAMALSNTFLSELLFLKKIRWMKVPFKN